MYNEVKCQDVPRHDGIYPPILSLLSLIFVSVSFLPTCNSNLNSNLALSRTKNDFYAMEAMEKRPGDKVAYGENNGTESGS